MLQIDVFFSRVPVELYATEWSTGRRPWIGLELLNEKALKSLEFFRSSGAGTLIITRHDSQNIGGGHSLCCPANQITGGGMSPSPLCFWRPPSLTQQQTDHSDMKYWAVSWTRRKTTHFKSLKRHAPVTAKKIKAARFFGHTLYNSHRSHHHTSAAVMGRLQIAITI